MSRGLDIKTEGVRDLQIIKSNDRKRRFDRDVEKSFKG